MDELTFRQTYKQVEEIGKGGTGVVYRAFHCNLRKYVVLKRISVDTNFSLMRREVDILKNLRHRYLPTVYDFIEYNGVFFIVEDYIRGSDLDKYFKQKIFVSEQYVVKWLCQLCETLDYLHTRKPIIVHSDIKPGNIMIDENGDICLIDFNISFLHEKDSSVIGYSNHFCSPEQLLQAEVIRKDGDSSRVNVDFRSDIYSAAATFYAVMSGRIPYHGHTKKPLSNMKLPYSEGLCKLVDKGMAVSPDRRFQSARQMRNMLSHLEKMTEKYRRYKVAQALVSCIGVSVVATGIVFVALGNQKQVYSDYSEDISYVFNYYEQNGATEIAAEEADEVLSNEKYKKILSDNKMQNAQLLRMCGEYQCLKVNPSYGKAQMFYEEAFELVRTFGSYTDVTEYASNYVFALIMCGRTVEAQSIADGYIKEGAAKIAVDAEIAYNAGRYEELLSGADLLLSSYPDAASSIKINVFLLAEEYENTTGNYEGALKWAKEILSIKPTDISIRRVMSLCLSEGNRLSANDNQTGASKYYKMVVEHYNKLVQSDCEEKVLYAEALCRLEEYDKSLITLREIDDDELKSISDSILFNKYYITVINYYQLREMQQAENAFQSAKKIFDSVSDDDEKKEIETRLRALRPLFE